jgi:NDP-sugar pyrophosphorylase family protein
MPSLLVLAAGLGSRYGGLKQIDPVGPSGETLLDYAVFDALRAGFRRVVFVIRRDFEEAFRDRVVSRYAGRTAVELAFQSLDDLPPDLAPPVGRTRPWGTAQAVWCARHLLAGNFAVINADDFYGAEAFRQLAGFLAVPASRASFALVGYRLAGTLSENGGVSRGLCRCEAGRLRSIAETHGITPEDVGPGRRFTGEEIVSMNCWGFTPRLFPLLGAQWREFLAERGGELDAECYLPAAVSAMLARGSAEVAVRTTEGRWFGITHRDDRPRVAAAIAELVRAGEYPEKLF